MTAPMKALRITALLLNVTIPAQAQTPDQTFLNGYFQQVPANQPNGPIVSDSLGNGSSIKTLATGSLIARTNAARAADEINANDYLTCDGSTDNAAAFGTIAARLALSIGKTVYFPPQAAPCMTSASIAAVSGATYRAAPGTVIIKAIGTSTANPLLVSANAVTNVLFYGLTFDGNLAAVPAASNVGTVFGSTGVVFDHVTVQHTRGIGLLFSTGVSNSGVRSSVFTDLGNYWKTSGNNADQQQGIAFCCGANNVANFVNDSYFSDTGLDALSVALQTDFQASGNRFKGVGGRYANGGAAIYASSNIDMLASGNVVDGTFGNGFDLHTMTHATLAGNYVKGAGGSGISLATVAVGTVSGNTVLNSNQGGTSSLNSGMSVTGTNSALTFAANTATDDQTTKTQQFGIQGLASQVCTNCTFDGSNELDGNAQGAFGGTVSGYSSKVSATVTWGGQVGAGATQGVQLNPGATGALMIGTHDGSNTGGNLPGANANDFCQTRASNGQVASGQGSGCLWGGSNQASGQFSAVGGSQNVANGPGTFGRGEFVDDRFRSMDVFAFGTFATRGDGEVGTHILRALTTSTTPTRVLAGTSTGGAASALNCVNLPNINFSATLSASYTMRIFVQAFDFTAPGNIYTYSQPHALLYKTGAFATTVYVPVGTPTTNSIGTPTGTPIVIAADTANACLSITWTAPNADTWHVLARVETLEGF